MRQSAPAETAMYQRESETECHYDRATNKQGAKHWFTARHEKPAAEWHRNEKSC